MLRRIVWGLFAGVVVIIQYASASVVYAEPSVSMPRVAIAAIQSGGKDAGEEMITLINTTSDDIIINDWTVYYVSSSGKTTTKLLTLSDDSSTDIVIPRHSPAVLATSSYITTHPAVASSVVKEFTGAMATASASIVLKDELGNTIDTVGWGAAAVFAGATAAPTLTSTTMLRRIQYTGDNGVDFIATYQVDVCANIDGQQEMVPYGYASDDEQFCTRLWSITAIALSELMPNPSGVDAGHEYIELVNEQDIHVDLSHYFLRIGTDEYDFPAGATIAPRTFASFSDKELGITFTNGVGKELELVSVYDEVIDTMEAYVDAPDDNVWQRYDDMWQYSNQPSRDAENLPNAALIGERPLAAVRPDCAVGYYRHDVTNRCRKIPVDVELAACKEGQYRSEETGRCRSIASIAKAELKPCDDDQFRNPATGRCKKIAAAEDIVTPCDAGWERNPETKRCRKVRSSTMPPAAFPVEAMAESPVAMASWGAVGGISAVAVGYGGWEWRREVFGIARRLLQLFPFLRR